MSGPPNGRGFAAWIVLLATSIAPAAAASRPSDGFAVQGPSETAAPADSTLATACQTGARERFEGERPAFGRASHTVLGDTRIVRMDLSVAGEPFRAVCTREGAGGAVETVVFAAPADESGPRVIVLGGPPPGTRPRAATPAPVSPAAIAQPSGDVVYQGYDSGYLPGLWAPEGAWGQSFAGRKCLGCRSVVVNGSRVTVTQNGTVVAVTRTTPRFVERVPGSSAPFATGGIASPAISNFPPVLATPGAIRFRAGGMGRASIGGFGR